MAPGFTPEQWTRLAFFMRIILPAQIFFLCGACVTALLFMRRQFRVPALAPLIYNGAIIAVGLLLPWLATTQAAQAALPAGLLAHMDGMTGYCVGVTLGAALGTFVLPLRVVTSRACACTWNGGTPSWANFCSRPSPHAWADNHDAGRAVFAGLR